MRLRAALLLSVFTCTVAAGDTVRATVLADAGHFVLIDPQSGVWPQVAAAARRLASIDGAR